jgi:predicted AlkP superfamily phosphohydrolase/phosphomutase
MTDERNTDERRLLIVGWDGADWDILRPLMDEGLLPTLSSMVSGGASGTLISTLPTHSWAAWPSFLTGLSPAGHGVFDFVERHPEDPQRRIPVTATSIKALTFFELLSDAGVEVRAANIPVTFPPIEVRGRMIGGVAIPRGARFAVPDAWADELGARAPFPVNGLEWNQHRGSPEALLDEAERLIDQRTASYEVLLEGSWTVAACVYLASDRLQHPFGACLLPEHPDHERERETPVAERLRAMYGRLDAALERLIAAAGDDTTVVLMSDHGFRPVTRSWNLDRLLAELGFAKRHAGGSMLDRLRRSDVVRAVGRTRLGGAAKRRVKAPSGVDWDHAVAYESTIDGGISLNLKGREPRGIVDPADHGRLCAEIREAPGVPGSVVGVARRRARAPARGTPRRTQRGARPRSGSRDGPAASLRASALARGGHFVAVGRSPTRGHPRGGGSADHARRRPASRHHGPRADGPDVRGGRAAGPRRPNDRSDRGRCARIPRCLGPDRPIQPRGRPLRGRRGVRRRTPPRTRVHRVIPVADAG